MSLIAPAQGIQRWPSLTSYFQRGTTPNEIWYALGTQNQTVFGASTYSDNVLFASAFTVSRTVKIDSLALEITAGNAASRVARNGIYKATGIANVYPSSLVVDSGELDCSTAGVKAVTGLSVTLSPGAYWVVHLSNHASLTFRVIAPAGGDSILGAPSTIATTLNFVSVAFAYAALPATFPGGAVSSAGALRFLTGARFSQ